jgi:hypothetical protein
MMQGPSKGLNTGKKLKFRCWILNKSQSFPQGPGTVQRSNIEFLDQTIDTAALILLLNFSKHFLIGIELQFPGIHREREGNGFLWLSGGEQTQAHHLAVAFCE